MPSPATMTTVSNTSGAVPTEELYKTIPPGVAQSGLNPAGATEITNDDISEYRAVKELKEQQA